MSDLWSIAPLLIVGGLIAFLLVWSNSRKGPM